MTTNGCFNAEEPQESGYYSSCTISMQTSDFDQGNQQHCELDDIDMTHHNSEICTNDPVIYIEDMEPQDANILDFTYRGAELMENFYAGPSHWKFLKQNRSSKTKKTERKRKLTKDITLSDVRRYDMNAKPLLLLDFRAWRMQNKGVRRSRLGKVTLPFNYIIKENIFDGFTNCSLNLEDPIYEAIAAELSDELDEPASYDYNFLNQDSSLKPISNITRSAMNLRIFANNSKRANIKRIRSLSLSIIETETQHGSPEVKFSVICKKIRKMFKETTESSSCALTFFAILLEASDEKISLKQGTSINDFTVKMNNVFCKAI